MDIRSWIYPEKQSRKISTMKRQLRQSMNHCSKALNTVSKDFYELEILKSTIEHRDLMLVEVFILQYAKLRMMELYHNFFDKIYDVTSLKDWRWTQFRFKSLWLNNLYDCVQPYKRAICSKTREHDCRNSFKADAKTNYIPWTCCSTHDKRELKLF